jgi:biotin transporter BioY
VLMVAMALGSRLGTLALAAHLIEGLDGLPSATCA